MKPRLCAQARKHGTHPEPGEVGGPLGMGLLQPVERLGALVEADVHLCDSRRRNVALAREAPEVVQDTPRAVDIPGPSVKIPERRENFGTSAGEANRDLQFVCASAYLNCSV